LSFFFPENEERRKRKKKRKKKKAHQSSLQWDRSNKSSKKKNILNPFICLPGVMGRAPEFYLPPLYMTCFLLLLSFQIPSSDTSSCMDYLPLFLTPPAKFEIRYKNLVRFFDRFIKEKY
jgi:hypothetical protein